MRAVVFSDLDGTLLDHESYAWERARPALEALKVAGIPLVLASSKTAAEMAGLHNELGLGKTPAIVENGAGLYEPALGPEQDAQEYEQIRKVLGNLAAPFQGFGDLGLDGIVAATGLSTEVALQASKRCFSEPGLWQGSDAELEQFIEALKGHGITARMGGRFLTLSYGRTKADRMAEIAGRLRASVTIALGDAPNDREMLEAADHGVIVRNDHGAPLPELEGEKTGKITRTQEVGPAGWNTAVLRLLRELRLE